MKPVKLNQLLFNTGNPCLSFYVPFAAAMDSLETRIRQRLGKFPVLLAQFEKELPAIHEVLKRHPDDCYGFYLSAQRRGYLLLDHDTPPSVFLGESFHLGPVLEEIFTNPEFALVLLSETEMSLFKGDTRQVELLERHEYSHHAAGPHLVYGQTSMVTPSQRRGLKQLMLNLHQSALVARLPVVVAGKQELVDTFTRSFEHGHGVVKLHAPHFTELTCPQLLKELPLFRAQVVELHAENFKLRLRGLVRSGRILGEMKQVIQAVADERVLRLLLPERRQLWGQLDIQKAHYEVRGIHPMEGAQDILEDLAEAVIRQGGKIQFLPAHFFPHGSHAMAILRGETHAPSSVFRMASNAW